MIGQVAVSFDVAGSPARAVRTTVPANWRSATGADDALHRSGRGRPAAWRPGDGAQFLLAQRPPGKVYAGYWEFPGGKVEPGETRARRWSANCRKSLA
ncbi:MAG: NUDIX domain-containing protein [Candidatus Accumulibacter sp. UW25]